jgi:ComEC/Rec2-related protein
MLATDFNEAQYLASLDVQWLAIAMLPHVAITEARTNLASQTVRLVQIAAAQTSRAIRERVCMMFPSSTEGFALALLTGDRSLLPASTQHEYALAGTAHVLAVSGLHIGLLAVIMLVPLAWLPSRHSTWNAWLKTLLFSVSIAAFVLLTGASPSSVRAGVMAVLLVVVRVMQREAHLLNVVAFTVVIMLAVQPAWMLSVSFQLSVLALVGIAALYPMMNDGFAWLFGAHKRAFMRLVAASLAVTLASSVVVAPLVAWYFGVFSFVAPVANLLVVPASSAAMLYTLAAVLMSWLPLVGWPVATLFASAAHGLLWVMDVCNHLAASAPLAFVEGVWALPAAVLCSASVVYVLSAFAHADRVDGTGAHPAFTARLLVFRLLVAAVAVALCIVLWRPFVSVSPTNLIIARPQVVAAILPCTTHDASNGLTGRTVIVLQDRRFDPALDATPRRDAGLEQYVVQYVVQYLREHAHAGEGKVNQDGAAPDSLLLCVTGPCSIWLASRIAAQVDEELSKKASERVSVSVLATSLQYKQARMFSALDSLDARRVRVVNAQEFLRRDSILAISTLTGRVAWHPWRAVLVMPSGKRVVLPNYINTDTDTDISKDIHKDIHNDIRIYADVAGDAQKP